MSDRNNKDSISVMLFHPDDKEIHSMKEENIYEDKLKTNLYDKDDEELYIATSPAFSPVQAKSSGIEDLYDSEHEICEDKSPAFSPVQTKSGGIEDLYDSEHEICEDKPDVAKIDTSKCAEQFELDGKSISDDSFSTDSPAMNYSPIKASDSYPVINDTSSYFVAADYSHMNIDVSKAYFYVLSPTSSSSALLRASSDEPLIRVNSDQLMSITSNDSKCLDSDQVTPCISEHRLSSDDDDVIHDSPDLPEFKAGAAEDIDLVQGEIEENGEHSVHGHFDNLSGDLHFINSIDNSVDDTGKERSHLIWQPLSSHGEQEKHGEQSHSLLMKYDHESKMESPVLHVQPYLHVALVNDMDPSSTGEFVSTDQILGVTVPEIFSCKWEGCGTHTLTREDLIKHVNANHVVSEQKNNYTSYTCFWKGCVRERKPFDARYKLVIHLRTHTGDKPHGCPVKGCEATFSRIENLKIHMRSHTGEKPYPCQFEGCKKSFANSSDRFKHKRTHTEKKPYRCPMIGCGKSYTDPSSLRKHKKRHLLDAKKRSEMEELDRRKHAIEYTD